MDTRTLQQTVDAIQERLVTMVKQAELSEEHKTAALNEIQSRRSDTEAITKEYYAGMDDFFKQAYSPELAFGPLEDALDPDHIFPEKYRYTNSRPLVVSGGGSYYALSPYDLGALGARDYASSLAEVAHKLPKTPRGFGPKADFAKLISGLDEASSSDLSNLEGFIDNTNPDQLRNTLGPSVRALGAAFGSANQSGLSNVVSRGTSLANKATPLARAVGDIAGGGVRQLVEAFPYATNLTSSVSNLAREALRGYRQGYNATPTKWDMLNAVSKNSPAPSAASTAKPKPTPNSLPPTPAPIPGTTPMMDKPQSYSGFTKQAAPGSGLQAQLGDLGSYAKANIMPAALGAGAGALGGLLLGGDDEESRRHPVWSRIKRMLMYGALGGGLGLAAPAAVRFGKDMTKRLFHPSSLTPEQLAAREKFQAVQARKDKELEEANRINQAQSAALRAHIDDLRQDADTPRKPLIAPGITQTLSADDLRAGADAGLSLPIDSNTVAETMSQLTRPVFPPNLLAAQAAKELNTFHKLTHPEEEVAMPGTDPGPQANDRAIPSRLVQSPKLNINAGDEKTLALLRKHNPGRNVVAFGRDARGTYPIFGPGEPTNTRSDFFNRLDAKRVVNPARFKELDTLEKQPDSGGLGFTLGTNAGMDAINRERRNVLEGMKDRFTVPPLKAGPVWRPYDLGSTLYNYLFK